MYSTGTTDDAERDVLGTAKSVVSINVIMQNGEIRHLEYNRPRLNLEYKNTFYHNLLAGFQETVSVKFRKKYRFSRHHG